MRIAQESLASALARGLRSAYLVTGAEPLLIGEACDQIRQAARRDGYAEREVHFLDRGFDWNGLIADTSNLSLFARRRLIELRLAGPIDAAASHALTDLAERPPPDTVLLVSGELERKSLQAAWVQAFEKAAALLVTRPVGREELPRWIAERLARHGVSFEPSAARLLADRVEGNLLAAQQAVERIALVMPGTTLDADAVAALVADSARFDVFELATAAFAGEAARALQDPCRPARGGAGAAAAAVGPARGPARPVPGRKPPPAYAIARRGVSRRARLGKPAAGAARGRPAPAAR